MMRFDDARHWIPIYRVRFGLNPPAIQMRICTSFVANKSLLPQDVPCYKEYAPALLIKLL